MRLRPCAVWKSALAWLTHACCCCFRFSLIAETVANTVSEPCIQNQACALCVLPSSSLSPHSRLKVCEDGDRAQFVSVVERRSVSSRFRGRWLRRNRLQGQRHNTSVLSRLRTWAEKANNGGVAVVCYCKVQDVICAQSNAASKASSQGSK